MDLVELKNIIENARINKGISQRELAKLSGISRSTLNDLINGKIKKIDVGCLKKLAETLNLSLTELLRLAGYNDLIDYLSMDKYKNKSTKDLMDMIEKYKKSELELLDFDNQKRKTASKVRAKLFETKEKLNIEKTEENIKVFNETIELIEWAIEELKIVQEKYDYSKLPKDV